MFLLFSCLRFWLYRLFKLGLITLFVGQPVPVLGEAPVLNPDAISAALVKTLNNPPVTLLPADLYQLTRIYEQRNYTLIWGLPDDLLTILLRADEEGLRPDEYHAYTIQQLDEYDINDRVIRDLLLTDAFIKYTTHIAVGRFDPGLMDPDWHIKPDDFDPIALLQSPSFPKDVMHTIEDILPQDAGYARLKEALKYYRGLAYNGGWPVVSAGASLQQGDIGDRVLELRLRLLATGELEYQYYIDLYQSYIDEYSADIEMYQADINEYQSYIEEYRSDMEGEQDDIDNYQSYVEEYRSYIEEYRFYIEEYQSDIEVYQSYIDRYQREIDEYLFDEDMQYAIERFQGVYGLEEDGIVGPLTLAALNVGVEKRIEQIKLNMERWRWLPNELGERYLMVNMAGYYLQVIEHGQPVLDMRTIVGKPYRATPAFSDKISYLEYNPAWNIPPQIALEDLIPKQRRDPDFFQRKGIKVFSDWSKSAIELDLETIDWNAIRTHLPYKLQQEPGPKNSLGRVKFMFPNKFNVYLHDTPDKDLFKRNIRTFSSGCIRVEQPILLAAYVQGDTSIPMQQSIQAVIDTGDTQIVNIAKPIPIYLVYWTAWVGPDGTIHFRNDIYGRDRIMALKKQTLTSSVNSVMPVTVRGAG